MSYNTCHEIICRDTLDFKTNIVTALLTLKFNSCLWGYCFSIMLFLRRFYQIQFNSSGRSDPDLETRFCLTCPPGYYSFCHFFFFHPSPESATDFTKKKETEGTRSQHLHQTPPVTIKAEKCTSDNVQIKRVSLQDSTFLQPILCPPKLINEYHLSFISSSHD